MDGPNLPEFDDVVLEVKDLVTVVTVAEKKVRLVDRVSFALRRGRTTAIVGESGSGKTMTAMSLLRLLEPPVRVASGTVKYLGRDLLALTERQMADVRGARIAMVFQDPLTSLNPVLRIGFQIAETLRAHRKMTRAKAEQRAVELLRRVGVPDPEARAMDYPHHFSGGMRQRVLIASAISCDPEVIIADEPTTALDVTVQAKILHLLDDLRQETKASLLLITHDLGVVAAMADDVAVMYAGRVVEQADVDTLFHAPRHPYTRALLACAINLEDDRHSALEPIPGAPPDPAQRPSGCPFHPRCPDAVPDCRRIDPPLEAVSKQQSVACIVVQRALAGA